MRSFKKYWKPAFFFLCPLVLVNILGYYVGNLEKDSGAIVDKFKRTEFIESHIKMNPDKINVMMFGASEMYSGINPLHFDSLLENKTNSINMGMLGLPIGAWYFSLKKCVNQRAIPQYVILDIGTRWDVFDLFFDLYADEGISAEEFISYVIHRNDRNFILNFLLPAHKYYVPISSCRYDSIFHSSYRNGIRASRKKLLNSIVQNRGYHEFDKKSLADDFSHPGDNPNKYLRMIDFKNDYYINQFLELCKKYHIKVLAISSPMRKGECKQYDQTPKEILELMQKYSNVYIKSGVWELNFYENKFFCDEYHPNDKGVRLFTTQVAKDFNKVFNITPSNQ
jgi:hypothetical protein